MDQNTPEPGTSAEAELAAPLHIQKLEHALRLDDYMVYIDGLLNKAGHSR